MDPNWQPIMAIDHLDLKPHYLKHFDYIRITNNSS